MRDYCKLYLGSNMRIPSMIPYYHHQDEQHFFQNARHRVVAFVADPKPLA